MTRDAKEINELITSIYSAPLDSSRWYNVMTGMAHLFDGAASILAFADLKTENRTSPETNMVRWYDHNAGVENMQAYLDHADHDVRTAYGLLRPGQVYVDHDFISDQGISRHRFYQEFLKPFDLGYTVGAAVPTSPRQAIVANVIRGANQSHADDHDVALMGMLYPHIAQAVRIGDKLDRLSLENAALRDAFDHLSDGVFIVAGDGSIITANRAADMMIKARDGLQMVAGLLTASHGPTADKLRKLVAGTTSNEPGQSPQVCALPIPKPSGGRSLHLLAMPVVTSMEAHFSFLSGRPSTFIVVSDPDQQPTPPEERLRTIFGLTNAEARLAAALVAGHTISEYADESGITENTARWTLKQIQAKTDCRRQADLVRLLVTTTKTI